MSGLGQRDGKAGGEKWSYATYILKVEVPASADGLVWIVRKIKESRMTPKWLTWATMGRELP